MYNPITHRRVLAIAGPIVLSNATVPILGIVDTGVVGQLGEAAPIGAVGIGAGILTMLYWVFGFLRLGTSGLVAQAYGAGDVAETGALLTRALLFSLIAGVGLVLLQWPLFTAAFWVAPASEEVESLAAVYLGIRIWGAPATIGLFAITGWLIAMERTTGVLVLQLVQNGLNIALSIYLGLELGWGVTGVAAATLIAEITGFCLGLWLCREAFSGDQWRDWARVFDRARIRRMTEVSGDIFIRNIVMEIAFTSFLFLGARFGDTTLAANHILIQFLAVTAYALDGFAFAAESLVGQAFGAKAPARVRRAAIVTSQWGFIGAAVLGVAFWLSGPAIIDLMAKAPDVQAQTREFLPWLVAAPLLSVASWMLDGIFIGATRTRALRNAMLTSLVVYGIAVATLATSFGNHGLWAAIIVFNLARAVTLGMRYTALERAAG